MVWLQCIELQRVRHDWTAEHCIVFIPSPSLFLPIGQQVCSLSCSGSSKHLPHISIQHIWTSLSPNAANLFLPRKYPPRVSYIEVNWGTESLSNLPQVSLLILVELGFKPSQSGYTFCPVNLYAILPLWTYILDESVNQWVDRLKAGTWNLVAIVARPGLPVHLKLLIKLIHIRTH